MSKLTMQLSFLSSVFLWFCATLVCIAQAPAPDLDSILHDAQYRMNQRQQSGQSVEFPEFTPPSYPDNRNAFNLARVPNPRDSGIFGYVSDPGDYLTSSEEQRLNELLFDLEQKSSAEVAVVILPSIGAEVPKDFAVKLFDTWGIGKSDTDNGLLILTIMDQHRTEFEVGYGLEPILTDVVCYRIGVNEIVPNFKKGNYGLGLEKSVIRIKEFLENPNAIEEVYGFSVYHDEQDSDWRGVHLALWIYVLLCVVFGFWYFGQAFDIQLSKDDYYDKYHRLFKLKFVFSRILFPLPMLFFGIMAKKRLHKYRYAPRYSKINGKPMQIQDEWVENNYLEAEQILEEKLNSVCYDVWVAEDDSDVMILEYEGPNGRKYSDCKKCGYKTFGKSSSLVLVASTYDQGGTRLDKYECRNCNYIENKEIRTPRKSRPSTGSSSSSSSRSRSSSSFGGGRSGGGGSGVSW